MNYVSAVYAVVVLIITIDWLVRGKREYRGQGDRKEAIIETMRSEAEHGHGHDG